MKIGFIGLGIMGKPMVHNLQQAGYELVVYDHHTSNMEEAKENGAIIANSSAQVALESDFIITMLPDSPQVKEVVCASDGILTNAKTGLIIVDMSSISPIASLAIAKECEKHEVIYLDAPVSGGEPKAIDGSLSIMVGGKPEIFDKLKEIFAILGDSYVLCGDVGAGNITKLANQMIVASNIAILSEALVFAKKANVNPQTVYEAIQGGLAGSTVMDAKALMMINGNFKPGFRIDLHIKDLKNAIDSAHSIGAPANLSVMVMEMMQMLKSDGDDKLDHSAIVKYYEKMANLSLNQE